jgi:hypothetical protein
VREAKGLEAEGRAPIFLVAGIEVSRKRRTATEVTESPAPKGRRP